MMITNIISTVLYFLAAITSAILLAEVVLRRYFELKLQYYGFLAKALAKTLEENAKKKDEANQKNVDEFEKSLEMVEQLFNKLKKDKR